MAGFVLKEIIRASLRRCTTSANAIEIAELVGMLVPHEFLGQPHFSEPLLQKLLNADVALRQR